MNPNNCIAAFINRPSIHNSFALVGRILISYIFITAGYAKIGGFAGTAAYMASKGIPEGLLSLVILLELGGGLAILFGFQTRIIALIFAIFCVASGLIFHGAPEEATNLMKNFALAGGFIFLALQGAGQFSIDRFFTQK